MLILRKPGQFYTEAEVDALIATVSGGTSEHNQLNNLDYDSSGHTGFTSYVELTSASGYLQTQLDSKANSSHIHDDRYYTEVETSNLLTTLSGQLQLEIDTKSDFSHIHDDRYYTEIETEGLLTTLSGNLQSEIDTKSDTSHLHDDRYYTESEIDVLITTISGKLDDHNELNNLDYASSGHTGFASLERLTTTSGAVVTYVDEELTTLSGFLQSEIDSKSDTSHSHDDFYYTEGEIDSFLTTLSGELQDNINTKSDSYHLHDDRYYTESEVDILLTTLSGLGITSHDELTHLDYASSGHTGFASAEHLVTLSGSLQDELDSKSDDTHEHDSTYLKIDGSTQFAGHIVPNMATASGVVSAFDIGSPTKKVRNIYSHDVYVDAGSLYVNEKKVIEDDSDVITFSTDPEQSLRIKTTGDGNIYIEPGDELNVNSVGGVELNVPATNPTKHINFTNQSVNGNITFTSIGSGGDVQFTANDDIDLTSIGGIISLTGSVDLSNAIVDHGELSGRADDDHSQYHNNTRGDIRYYQKSEVNSFLTTLSGTLQDDVNDKVYTTGTPLDNQLAIFTEEKIIEGDSNLTWDGSELNIIGISRLLGDTVITGNLTVSGTTFTTNHETVEIKDNLLLINNGEVGPGVTVSGGLAGIEVDRGSLTNYRFVFDESSDFFKLGEIGNLQSTATREDTPTDNYVPYWSESEKRFNTVGSLAYNDIVSNNLLVSTSGVLQSEINTKSALGHVHDDRYYTENEVDGLITTISGQIIEDHAVLNNLDYTSSGHTGFASSAYLSTTSGVLQSEIDTKASSSHLHDDRYYTESEIDSMLATVSGGFDDHNELNNLDYASSGHIGFQPAGNYLTDSEFATYSGTLQSKIDNKLHNTLSGIQGGITDEYYHITLEQYTNITNLSGTNTGDENLVDGTTTGQMMFWDGSNWTYTETSELFWDDINKRLGIGTDSPEANLDVYDDVSIGLKQAGVSPTKMLNVSGDINIVPVQQPLASFTLTATTGGALDTDATYWYSVSYGTADGWTPAAYEGSAYRKEITLVGAENAVNITDIPVSPDPRVTKRRIYRSTGGGSYNTSYLLVTIDDNTTTTYNDIIADGDLHTSYWVYRQDNSTVQGIYYNSVLLLKLGVWNAGLGYDSLDRITTGFENYALGKYSLRAVNTGCGNIGIGSTAGTSITSGDSNVCISYSSMSNNNGSYNIAIGSNSLRQTTLVNTSYCVAVGYRANTYGGSGSNYNVSIGPYAGYKFGGSYNTFIGPYAGELAAVAIIGDYNLFVGYNNGNNATTGANNNILIGKSLDLQTADGSNQLSIGNLIFGTEIDGTGTTVSTGNIGIGKVPITDKLEVAGNVTIGNGEAGVDYTLTFDGETNDGVITWMEDEDKLDFGNNVYINGSSSSSTPLTIKQASGQTSNSFELYDSTGTLLTYIDKYGEVYATKSQNGTTSFVALNSNTGGAAKAQFVIGQQASGGLYTILEHLGSNFTTSGIRKANWSLFTNFHPSGTAGCGFGTQNQNDTIMYTNNTERLIVDGTSGDITIKNDLTIGAGAAGTDYTLTFNGETNDGVITWMEDEDYFQFEDYIKLPSGTNINEFSIDGTLADNSDDAVPTEKAVKTYVDTNVSIRAITTKTNDYTITSTDYTIVVDASSNTVTITLPTAVGIEGTIYNIKCIDATYTCTLDANGTETIDGELTQTLNQWENIQVQSTGTGWIIL